METEYLASNVSVDDIWQETAHFPAVQFKTKAPTSLRTGAVKQ